VHKISIITPAYNSAAYIAETIESVLEQTYDNWEMIIVDDYSTDSTYRVVKNFCEKDERIILIRLEENSGAALARNTALQNAKGRFITYLDSDDLWHSQKLEKQVTFMLEKSCGFCCVSYEVIDNEGNKKNKSVFMVERLDYHGYLTNNLIQTVGVMVDRQLVPGKALIMPDMRRRQDAATWFQILKTGNDCYGMIEVLAKYRRAKNSLSSNKFKAVKGTWKLYRTIEKLPLHYACYCFACYAILAVSKRLYRKQERH
jgi:teichuronic acid biosynthesis glycosyltransferase TuaG